MRSQELSVKYGFNGPIPIGSLQEATSQIGLLPRMLISKVSDGPGVYAVATPPGYKCSIRDEVIRGKHMHLHLEPKMIDRWIKDTDVIYIGRAGGPNITEHLPDRIKLLIRHSLGKTTIHEGGEDIWLLEHDYGFLLYWKESNNPKAMEWNLLDDFKKQHDNKLPFGNKKSGDF
jgi:hypothetical protein